VRPGASCDGPEHTHHRSGITGHTVRSRDDRVGIRMLKFRGRTLGIVALSSGLLSIAGCYCLPTAIGLFIYGLIVLLNEPVKRAFAMGEQGRSASEIQNQFDRLLQPKTDII
jgi:hypothetical protein